MSKYLFPKLWSVALFVHHKYVGTGITEHQDPEQRVKVTLLVVTKAESLLLSEINHIREVIASAQALVEENKPEDQVYKRVLRSQFIE